MPVSALKAVSQARNGVGTFVQQCKRIDFHYCDWAGSSKGMNLFLKHLFPSFAAGAPSIAMHISPRPTRHPVIKAHYVNGAIKAVCVKNLAKEQVLDKAAILRDSSGEKNRRVKAGKFVKSQNESVRGIWSGLHAVAQEGDFWEARKGRSKAFTS